MYPEIKSSQLQLNQPAITASGNSPVFTLDGVLGLVSVDVVVPAPTGTTPSLTIQPQVSNDGVNWFNAGPAGAAITAAGTQRLSLLGVLENYARLAYIVSGTTPSFAPTIIVNQR